MTKGVDASDNKLNLEADGGVTAGSQQVGDDGQRDAAEKNQNERQTQEVLGTTAHSSVEVQASSESAHQHLGMVQYLIIQQLIDQNRVMQLITAQQDAALQQLMQGVGASPVATAVGVSSDARVSGGANGFDDKFALNNQGDKIRRHNNDKNKAVEKQNDAEPVATHKGTGLFVKIAGFTTLLSAGAYGFLFFGGEDPQKAVSDVISFTVQKADDLFEFLNSANYSQLITSAKTLFVYDNSGNHAKEGHCDDIGGCELNGLHDNNSD